MSENKPYLTTRQCEYFSLWDTETESLSEWGKQLYEANDSRLADESPPSLFERENIDEPDTLGRETKRKLNLAEETRTQESLPTECPHRAVDGEDHCLFHLSVDQVEHHDEVSPELVCSEFFDKVEQTTEEGRHTRKCFAGSKCSELSIQYQSFASKSNRPVQLQFAQIESLNLNSAIVDEHLILDGCEIESISCENTQFQREVSFESSRFDCETICFDGVVFDEKVSFDGSTLITTSVRFDDCEFKDETKFDNVDMILNSYENTPTATFKNTLFRGKFKYTGGVISVGDNIDSDISVKFIDCDFEDGADFSGLSLDPAEKLKSSEEPSTGSDDIWGDGESDTDDEFLYEIDLYIKESDFAAESQFEGLCIEGELELDDVEFSRGDVNFENIDIAGDASFKRAIFGTGKLSFEEAGVDGDANFEQARFSGYEANFTDFDTNGSLTMEGAVFEIGGGDIHFTDVSVGGQADFELASFVGKKVIFKDMIVEGGIEFEHAEFDTLVTDFSGMELRDAEMFDMSHTEFSSNKVYFEDVTLICHEVTFEEAKFDSDVNFSGLEVIAPGTPDEDSNSTFDMSHADFSSDDAKFEGVEINCDEVTFEETLFDSDAIFPGLQVIGAEKFDMSHMTFSSHKANFAGLQVTDTETFDMSHTTFSSDDVNFAGLQVTDTERFVMSHTTFSSDNANFRGMVLDCNLVTFESTTFDSNMSFSTLQPSSTDQDIEHSVLGERENKRKTRIAAGTFNVSHSRISGNIDFKEARLECDNILFNQISGESAIVNFDGVESGDTTIEFNKAVVMEGNFYIDGCETVYDFTGATIGDIEIKNDGKGNLFEHFIFRDTDFDGFDFSKNKVKNELKQTGWNIHTSHYDSRTHSGGYLQPAIQFLKRSYRLIREGPDEANDPNELETTYMKAKLGADLQGDPDTVSQFFKKELHFRRQTYGYQFWDRSKSETRDESETENTRDESETEQKSRVKLAWDWVANMTLALTVGYGERPSNVVLTSFFIIFVFFFIYRGITALPAGATNLEYFTYSVQGFIQLIVAVETSGGILVRLFTAIQGFIGAFIIALFVITLTRSIDR